MLKILGPALSVCLLSACGLFSREEPVATVDESTGLIARPVTDGSVLMPAFVSTTPEPALRGVILRVTGVAGQRGYYAPYLRRLRSAGTDDSPVLVLEYRAFAAQNPVSGPNDASREIHAAHFISDADLAGITEIRIRTTSGETRLAR